MVQSRPHPCYIFARFIKYLHLTGTIGLLTSYGGGMSAVLSCELLACIGLARPGLKA